MHTLVANHLIDDETLFTVSSETEKIVNDCPLTYQCDYQRDPSALIPNTLLLCNRNPCSPAGELALNYSNLADMFWTGWIKEHIPTLQERQRWLSPKRNFSSGRPSLNCR